MNRTKQRNNPIKVIAMLVIVALLGFSIFWLVTNFDKIKDSFGDGSQLYTIEQLEEAKREEREKWAAEKDYYESYIPTFEGLLSAEKVKYDQKVNELETEKAKYNQKVSELETEKSAHNLSKQKITDLEEEIRTLGLFIQQLEGMIQSLQDENFDLINERNYYQFLLEAFENQDKVIVTFYADNVVHAVSILNPGEKLTDHPEPPVKEDYSFEKWVLNGSELGDQTFTQNADIHATFIQVRTSRLDYEFITTESGRQGYRITGSEDAIVLNNTVLVSEKYDDGINGEWPVLEIGESAFENQNGRNGNFTLKHIILPEGLEKIGNRAFYNVYFASFEGFDYVTIPSTVISIGDSAFERETISSNMKLRFAPLSKLKTIGDRAFRFASIANNDFKLPYDLRTIGKYAFEDAFPIKTILGEERGVREIVLPHHLEEVSQGAFLRNSLTNVVFNELLETIGNAAFMDNELSTVELKMWVRTIDVAAFAGNKITSVTLPDGLKIIEYQAFFKNELTSLVIPNSVTTIGKQAFYDNKLTSLIIGTGVTKIGMDAFKLNQLTSVVVPYSVVDFDPRDFDSGVEIIRK